MATLLESSQNPTSLPSTDFIPEIDTPLPDHLRTSLLSQIHAERPSNLTKLHPLVNTTYTPSFPPSLSSEHDRLAAGLPKHSSETMDFSRYESLDAPADATSPHSDESKPELLRAWRETLRKAYAQSSYLSSRSATLALLETYGKNAWLVGNWQLEAEVRALEAELADAKREAETAGDERRGAQEAAAAEMGVLEEAWKKGVGGIVEVQVATEALRREVLERRMEVAKS